LAILILAVHAREPGYSRAGLLLGNASYSVYLFHPPVISACLVVWVSVSPGSVHAAVAAISVFAIAVGIGIHIFLEKPLVAAVRRLLTGRRAATAVVKPA
jgi:exopolysaccharide production protein ExoZ